MVKIRLRRTGAKKQPHYRIVVAEASSPRDGKFIETIGHYNPRTDPPTVQVDAERALYWLGVGAQPTEAVRRILDREGIISRAEAIKRGEVPLREAVKRVPPAEPVPAEVEVEIPQALEEEEIPEEELEALEEWEEEYAEEEEEEEEEYDEYDEEEEEEEEEAE